jgi:hypothetical protein
MRLRARLVVLEQSKRTSACGPGCPSLTVVYVGDWYGGCDTQEEPAPCPRCGRPANMIRVVSDPNFYNNAHLFEGTEVSAPRYG